MSGTKIKRLFLQSFLLLTAISSLVSCKKNESPAPAASQDQTTETTSNNDTSSNENSGEENKDGEEEKTVDVELPYI